MWARAILGVELRPGELAGVVVQAADRHEIAGAVVRPATSPAVGLSLLAPDLLARGRPVHVVLRGVGHLHRVQTLPPMSEEERGAYLARELRREQPEGHEWSFAHVVVGRVQEGEGPRDEVLVAGLARGDLDRLLASAEVARVRLEVVTTAPLALLRAGQALAPPDEGEPLAVALWDRTGLTIAVGVGEALLLARELPHVGAGVDPLERFASEIQRSLLFFRQQSRGRTVGRVLVGSALPDLATRFDALGDRLGVPVTDLNALLAPMLPPGPPEAQHPAPAEFLLAYGAAVTPEGHGLNLLPEPVRLGRRARRLRMTAAALAALLAVVVGVGYWARLNDARALERSLDELRAERARLVVEGGAAGEAGREREVYRSRLRLLKGLAPGLPVLPAALTEVGRLVPGPVRLERISVTTEAGPARMALVGVAHGPDLADAQAAVSAFYTALRASPLFDNVTLVPAKAEDEPPPAASAGVARRLPFELALVVRTLS